MLPRVVLLTKRHALSYHLAARLAERGLLSAVLFERGMSDTAARVKYISGYAKRFGLWRTADFVLYELVEGTIRAGAQEHAATLVPSPTLPNAVPQHDVESCNSPEARALIAAAAPDIIVVHATGILGKDTFGLAKVAAINVHGGVLPEYRGHASTYWALKRADYGNIGVTLHEVRPKVDTGRVFALGRVAVGPEDDDLTLWHRAIMLGADLLVDALEAYRETGVLPEVALDGAPGPHYPRRGLMGHLAWWIPWRRRRQQLLLKRHAVPQSRIPGP